MRLLQHTLAALLSLVAATAHAGLGTSTVPSLDGADPITVFYPTAAADRPTVRGPYTLPMAPDAPPARGNGRLVVISHGSGGGAWTYADLARQLVDAGFVVALPLHQGDNWKSARDAGPDSWKRRPAEVSRTIDAVAKDTRLAPLLALDKVGMYGMSAGGHTALALAGGRWSPSLMLRHCEAHLKDDFPSCVGLALQLDGGAFDGVKKAMAALVLRWKLDDAQWYSHEDRRIAAIVAEVPYAADFDFASLARPRVPLGIVQAGQDRWLAPRFHSNALLRACQGCELVADLPTAGHGSLLSPQPRMASLPDAARRLLQDPPGFDRALVPPAQARIVAFMRKHLVP